ncbi:MAG: hypothetical protein QXT43_01305 [Candidatus Micrarchaeaceae archaeon]
MQTRSEQKLGSIFIDIDGTLANMMERFDEVLRSEGLRPPREGYTTYNLAGLLGISKAELSRLFCKTWSEPEKIRPMVPGIGKIIDGFKENFEVVIITSNNYASESSLKQWLASHGIKYDRFLRVNEQLDKAKYAPYILIDDYGEVIRAHVERNKGSYAILIPWPYNEGQERTNERIYRIGWDQAEKKVNELALLLKDALRK